MLIAPRQFIWTRIAYRPLRRTAARGEVFVFVYKRTESGPYWLRSPKPERFQPPKVSFATGAGIGASIPTMPAWTRAVKSRAHRRHG